MKYKMKQQGAQDAYVIEYGPIAGLNGALEEDRNELLKLIEEKENTRKIEFALNFYIIFSCLLVY